MQNQDNFNQKNPPLSSEQFIHTINHSHEKWQERKLELDALTGRLDLLLFGYGGKGLALAKQISSLTGREVTVYDKSEQKREAAKKDGFRTIESIDEANNEKWLTILAACQVQLAQKTEVNTPTMYYQEACSYYSTPHLAHKSTDFSDYIFTHLHEHYQIYQRFHQDSRKRYLDILKFRVSNDPETLSQSRLNSSEMWLDIPSAFKSREYHTFLDIGAYDGDTLHYFYERFKCKRGIAVEANRDLFDPIKRVSSCYVEGIEILPVAAWSKNTRLSFTEVRGGMIRVLEDPNGDLPAAPIDEFVNERVDCIKMDIEGSEMSALTGCKRILEESMPDIAIAAYHRPNDFIEISSFLFNLGYDERFQWHCGHYSDCLDDSIIYILGSS